MANILPFRGTRFQVSNKRLFSLVCEPIDFMTDHERGALLALDEDNIIAAAMASGGPDKYENTAKNFHRLFDIELLANDKTENYYIYTIEYTLSNSPNTLSGIIGRCELEAYSEGNIVPTETAMPSIRDDRYEILTHTKAQFTPVFSLFSDPEQHADAIIAEVVAAGEPLSEVVRNGIVYRLYGVDEQTMQWRIQDIFKDKKLYIADGHNRYEAALAYKAKLAQSGETLDADHPASSVMMACSAIQSPGLCVYPAHRVVRNVEGFDTAVLIEKLRENFDVEPVTAADSARSLVSKYLDGKNSFLLYDGQWYSLVTLRDEDVLKPAMPTRGSAYRSLDVSVLQSLILEKIFKIDKHRLNTTSDIYYTHYTWEATQMVDNKAASCAFLLNPTRIENIIAVADQNERMPSKSNYFYPKLLTGLVINKL